MVEKFNFYDIYGYLLPGLVLISLAWLPFGLVFGIWPKAELGSALLALILAYVVGHFTQTLAAPLFPSTKPDKFGNRRYPSDVMLDTRDKKFTCDLKRSICQLSGRILGLELEFPQDLGEKKAKLKELSDQLRDQEEERPLGISALRKTAKALERQRNAEKDPARKAALEKELCGLRETITEAVRKSEADLAATRSAIDRERTAIDADTSLRRDAFFQARSALLKAKGNSYWEQFEGLYALMRGVSFAFGLAASYLAGWACGLGLRAFWGNVLWPFRYFGGMGVLAVLVIVALSWPGPSPPPSELPRWKRISLLSAIVLASLAAGGVLSSLTLQQDGAKKSSVPSLITIVTVQPEANPEGSKISVKTPALLVGFLGLLAAVMSFRCYGAYKAFADSFAEHVWRDFANIESKWSKPESNWSPQSPEFLSSPSQDS